MNRDTSVGQEVPKVNGRTGRAKLGQVRPKSKCLLVVGALLLVGVGAGCRPTIP
jgi:hypothetical protein